jgi:2,3-bisphosphoglycerate-dependent phosphoglycerate mutase/probable phosphoglycerate mutase
MITVRRHTDVWLVRHTQTDWNRARRYQSHTDRALTAFGEARAQAVAHRLRPLHFAAIVSSGLGRTDTLANLIAAHNRYEPPVQRDTRWREAEHGDWEGLTYGEVTARYPHQAQQRFADTWNSRAHGGESTADLWMRVEAAWNDLLDQYDGKRILVVTHATPIQLLLCALLGVPWDRSWQFRIDLGGITNLDLYPSGAITRVLNEVPPLIAPQKHRGTEEDKIGSLDG